MPERRDEADFGGAQHDAALQRDLSRLQVLAGAAQILAQLVAAADRYAVALGFDVFLHDDRVHAGGHDSARHDAHALRRLDCALIRHAGE